MICDSHIALDLGNSPPVRLGVADVASQVPDTVDYQAHMLRFINQEGERYLCYMWYWNTDYWLPPDFQFFKQSQSVMALPALL